MSLKRSSSAGTNVWTSGGSYNPWDILRLNIEEDGVPVDKGKRNNVGKGGLTIRQQKQIAEPYLQKWWINGEGWSPFNIENVEFKNCRLDLYIIRATTEVRVKLKKNDEEKEAFLFYSIRNPRKGTLTVNIFGIVTKKEIEQNDRKVRIAELHRSHVLGAEEFRQKMKKVYENNDISNAEMVKLQNLKRYAFLFPLRRSLTFTEKCGITAKQIESRMVNFVASAGWNETVDSIQAVSGWKPSKKPTWSTGDGLWSKDEFAPRHIELQGIGEYTDVASYLLGGIAAAIDLDYAELRKRAEKQRLKLFFSKWYNTENSIQYLLRKNGMIHLLGEPVNDDALKEYRKRNLVKQQPSVVLSTMNEMTSCAINNKNTISSSMLQKLEAEKKKAEENNSKLVLPEYYGLMHFTECPPSLLECGASLVRGKVMVFFNEIEEVILHLMELDQIFSNGKVRLNEQIYGSSPIFAFAKDALILAKIKQEISKTKIGGNIFNVSISSSSADNSGKCGNLDIDVEDLLKISPLCVTNMITNCQRQERSLKHYERIALTRFLSGMGIPINVYESIAYPLFVKECEKNGERNTSEAAFRKRWNGKSMFSGKYSNLSCMSVKKVMDGAQSVEMCKCPFVDIAKMFNVNFTKLCRDHWNKEHKGYENIMKDLYYPSQHVYASLKAKKWKRHIEIESGE